MNKLADYQYINAFLERNQTEQIFLDAAFEGCSVAEIEELEKTINYTLPQSIKEFLRFSGKRWKGIYVLEDAYKSITDATAYETLNKIIKRTKDEELKKVNVDEVIILEFGEHISEHYFSFFFKNDTSLYPIIYEIEGTIILKDEDHDPLPFLDFILRRFNVGKYYATRLFVSSQKELDKTLSYINPNAIKIIIPKSLELTANLPDILLKLPKLEEISPMGSGGDPYNEHRFTLDIPFVESLKVIDISQHELASIKFPAEGLPNLKVLRIYSENFDGILTNISQCKQLERLVIHNGNYHTFPVEIFELPNLKDLDLAKLTVSHIPEGLSKLTQLKSITLKGYFEVFPEELFVMNSLEKIDLSGNSISQIDERIKQLNNLKTLDIADNFMSAEAIEHLKTWIPEVELRNYRQRPHKKKEPGINDAFGIKVNADIREQYLKLLQNNKLFYIPGPRFIWTNDIDYDACLKILDELTASKPVETNAKAKVNEYTDFLTINNDSIYEKCLQILDKQQIKYLVHSKNDKSIEKKILFTNKNDYEKGEKILTKLYYPSWIDIVKEKILKVFE